MKLVAPAVDVVRRFHGAGGTPDQQMLDQLVDLCVRTGEFKVAMQAVRAMELMGTEVDKGKYKALVVRQMKRQERAGQGGGGGGGASGLGGRARSQQAQRKQEKIVQFERFKFWLGLPNSYYDNDASE